MAATEEWVSPSQKAKKNKTALLMQQAGVANDASYFCVYRFVGGGCSGLRL